ncbi:hypothetical protein EG328_005012 [Venturia inaequalis]|uniref:Uncharacterized protein n=1 Tax=Venturia inaequalis TaxID=5025 RepID=A0A8H3VEX4_VENIN|nr:hypothetical protein EG328_005012 [Venturia inaequalis]RDI88668.1 hypothetical protein Vi05172_g1643 [Venturia inaequalis]
MPPRGWYKFILTLLFGFCLGIVLGITSATLLFYLMPAQWLENGFADRRTRLEDRLIRRSCRQQGLTETFSSDTNRVEICVCWPDGGAHIGVGVMVSCLDYERRGFSELGA